MCELNKKIYQNFIKKVKKHYYLIATRPCNLKFSCCVIIVSWFSLFSFGLFSLVLVCLV